MTIARKLVLTTLIAASAARADDGHSVAEPATTTINMDDAIRSKKMSPAQFTEFHRPALCAALEKMKAEVPANQERLVRISQRNIPFNRKILIDFCSFLPVLAHRVRVYHREQNEPLFEYQIKELAVVDGMCPKGRPDPKLLAMPSGLHEVRSTAIQVLHAQSGGMPLWPDEQEALMDLIDRTSVTGRGAISFVGPESVIRTMGNQYARYYQDICVKKIALDLELLKKMFWEIDADSGSGISVLGSMTESLYPYRTASGAPLEGGRTISKVYDAVYEALQTSAHANFISRTDEFIGVAKELNEKTLAAEKAAQKLKK